MTYRLKDTELQKKLDSFTGGEFSDSLRDNPIVGPEHVAVVCGEPVPGIRERLSPDHPDERPARRFTVLFSRDEVEEVPDRLYEVAKAEVQRWIESLRGSLRRIERSLGEDEPDAADVRWGFAKAIIIENLDRAIRSYLAEAKRKEKE